MKKDIEAEDRAAIREEFLSELKKHTLMDLHGTAAPLISEKLRTEYIEEWSRELAALCTTVSHPAMKRKLALIRVEAAHLRQAKRDREKKEEEDREKTHVRAFVPVVEELTDIDLSDQTINGSMIILLAHILAELRALE